MGTQKVFLIARFLSHLAFSLVLHGSTCFVSNGYGGISFEHSTIARSDVEFSDGISTLLSPTVIWRIFLPPEMNLFSWRNIWYSKLGWILITNDTNIHTVFQKRKKIKRSFRANEIVKIIRCHVPDPRNLSQASHFQSRNLLIWSGFMNNCVITIANIRSQILVCNEGTNTKLNLFILNVVSMIVTIHYTIYLCGY